MIKKIKNKRSLVAIVVAILVVTIGVTYALFFSSSSLDNLFGIGNYNVVTSETFTSPASWQPGEKVDKTITATNNGDIQAAFRVKYTEKWEDSSGNDITSSVPSGTVTINFENGHDWSYNSTDGYYYYNWIIEPNTTTSSLISGVTLNQDLMGSANCSMDGNTYNCTSNLNGLAGATYTLTFTKETVVYSKYQQFWNTNQSIGEYQYLYSLPEGKTASNLQVGDEVCINGETTECFNFIKYDNDDIIMLAKYNLNVGDNLVSGTEGVQNSLALGDDGNGDDNAIFDACVPFSTTNYWVDGSSLKSKYGSSYPVYVYDSDYNAATGNNYSIAYYVENYKNILLNYGAAIKEARLLTYDEATLDGTGCIAGWGCTNGFIMNTSFYLGTATSNNKIYFIVRNPSTGLMSYNYDLFGDSLGVRPVITISKSEVNRNVTDANKFHLISLPANRTKENLEVGDEVCINGDTTECFNFVGYDGNDVKLLSKYNLNVGNNIQQGTQGVQNSLAIGWNSESSTKDANNMYPATVAFSATYYWYDGSNLKSKYGSSYPADVYDTDYKTAPDFSTTCDNSTNCFRTPGYSVAYYAEEYKNKLTEYGATIKDVRLLTYAEATDSTIGCVGTNTNKCPTTGFITNTSFWLGSAGYNYGLWYVESNGHFGSIYHDVNTYGVRPVIVINKNNL